MAVIDDGLQLRDHPVGVVDPQGAVRGPEGRPDRVRRRAAGLATGDPRLLPPRLLGTHAAGEKEEEEEEEVEAPGGRNCAHTC